MALHCEVNTLGYPKASLFAFWAWFKRG
jgi:hypothetical protein